VSDKSFDAQGHYNLGFEDQSVWPELSFEDTAYAHGLQVTFVIEAETTEHAQALLSAFGLPFAKKEKN
jgi:large subunit ribosomal protein L5